MIASSRPDQVISEFVLAVLEGSGWYKPDYSMAEKMTWGKGKGCGFYDGPCVDKGGMSKFSEYCTPLTQKGCSFNHRGKAFCGSFPGYVNRNANLPASWDYWGNKTSVGYLFNDNCPVYNYYAYSDCENVNSKAGATLAEESFGPSSRCFAGTLTTKSTVPARGGYCFNSKVFPIFSQLSKLSLV